jgi:hypothetical protein
MCVLCVFVRVCACVRIRVCAQRRGVRVKSNTAVAEVGPATIRLQVTARPPT